MKDAKAVIVAGLGFGDEGKGTITDALARKFGAATVVRYNGGPQAGHNVVTPEGVWHCFAQFGSGTFVPESTTLLSKHMLLSLENLEVEKSVLEEKGVGDAASRLVIDPLCLVITPMQKIVGRMREIARGGRRHGSCGQGVGETVLDSEAGLALQVVDLIDDGLGPGQLHRILDAKTAEARRLAESFPSEEMSAAYAHFMERADINDLWYRYRLILRTSCAAVKPSALALAEARQDGRTIIFEGAQGALLDRTRGSAPYVTKSDTTCRNALDLLERSGNRAKPYKLGILRAYGHRHGAGPLPTEDGSLQGRFDDPRNGENPWQGKFRVGWLDLHSIKRGIEFNGGIDGLALTCLDQLSGMGTLRVLVPRGSTGQWIRFGGWQEDVSGAKRVEDLPKSLLTFLGFVEYVLRTPIKVISVGPCADQKIFLD